MYQAIIAACRNVRALLCQVALAGAAAALAAAPACGSAPARGGSAQPAARDSSEPPPPVRVSFSSRSRRSFALGDRVAIFDRVAFAAPSAIVYDRERDLYWVSNLNGEGPVENGFISRLEPDAERSTLNYIDGRRGDVELDQPRGIDVFGGVLYVADVRTVRRFKATNGEPLGDLDIPGAVFLSDVAVALDGSIYVADVGGHPAEAAIAGRGADAVYRVSPAGQVGVVARRADLGGPYALLANETGLWVTCTGANELLLLVPSEANAPVGDAGRLALPEGATPRGLGAMPDGTFVIASEENGTVYRGYPDGPFQPVVTDLESPADVGYDTKRKRLLIPLLTGHSLAIFELPPLPTTPEPP